jgi:transcriptional regulator with XRE-family HTH domain
MRLNRHALRVIRERSGLSLTELARTAGISQPHLSNLERGRRQASPATVRRLADALRVPVPALLADDEAPPGPIHHVDADRGPRLFVDPTGDGPAGLRLVVEDDG